MRLGCVIHSVGILCRQSLGQHSTATKQETNRRGSGVRREHEVVRGPLRKRSPISVHLTSIDWSSRNKVASFNLFLSAVLRIKRQAIAVFRINEAAASLRCSSGILYIVRTRRLRTLGA